MTSSILELVGELNRVIQYYTLDYNITMECSIIGTNLRISVDYVRTTNCFLTVKTLIHLFGAKKESTVSKMSDNCVVEIECEEKDYLTHTFLYSGGYMYSSYTAEYTLKRTKIDKDDISEMLNEFSAFPNSDTWEKLTGVKVPKLIGRYDITISNLTNCDFSQIKTNAIILINNALQALETGEGDHQHDFYTYIFALGRICGDPVENGIKYLNDLLSKIV